MSENTLFSELFDHIIDHLHNDHPTLLSCSLVCREWLPGSRYHLFRCIRLYCDSTDRTLKHFKNFMDVCPSLSLCVRELRVQASRKMRIYTYPTKRATRQGDGDDDDGKEVAGNIQENDEVEEDRGEPNGFLIPQETIDLRELSAVTHRLTRLHTVYLHGISWPGGLKTGYANSEGEPWPRVAALSVHKLVAAELEDGPNIMDFLDIFQLFPHVKVFEIDSVWLNSDPEADSVSLEGNSEDDDSENIQIATLPLELQLETVMFYGYVPISLILLNAEGRFLSTINSFEIDFSCDFDPDKWSSVVNHAYSPLTHLDIGVNLDNMDWSSINIPPCIKLESLSLSQLSWYPEQVGIYGGKSRMILSRMPPTLRRVTFIFREPKAKFLREELEAWDWSSLNGVLSHFVDFKVLRFIFHGEYQKRLGRPIQNPDEDVKAIIRGGLPEYLSKGILQLT